MRTQPVNCTSCIRLLGYVLLFLLAVYPMVPALLPVKATLLSIVLVAVCILTFTTLQLGLHSSVVIWTGLLSALGFVFVMEGLVAGMPGASAQVGVYAIWPIVYLLLIAGVRSEQTLVGLTRTLVISTSCIALFSVIYMLIATNVLPENSYFDLLSFNWKSELISLHEGYIAMQYPGLNSLPFLVPFSLAVLVTCGGYKQEALISPVWAWTALGAGLEAVLLSGRRGLLVVTMLAPLGILVFSSFQPTEEKRLHRKYLVRVVTTGILALIVSMFSLNALSGISLSGLYERLSVGFDFTPNTDDNGANERRRQFHALAAGWMENPIFGAGHGAPAYGSVRSELQPWSYELSYMALLYQTGIVGIAVYAAGICWIFWMGVRVIRAGGRLSALMLACLTGMSSMLIANATNPYMDYFDAMWVIFFPLAVINLSLLRSSHAYEKAVLLRDSNLLSCS
jgi:hypothetical protein